jgi:hypothetical protein
MLNDIWKKRAVIFGVWTLLILAFSASSPFGIEFKTIFPMLLAAPLGVLTYLMYKDPDPQDNEEIIALTETITDFEKIVEEQIIVIKEYEDIFDTQLVELPCVCGGNTFKGLFSPNTENLVECEKCKNRYQVTINYDTVLLSEPLDQKSLERELGQI